MDRDRAFREFRRVLKTGGYLGDLEMSYQREPCEIFARQLHDEWDGFTTMPLCGWEKLFRDHGLEVLKVDDFSERLGNLEWTMMKELGIAGAAKMAWKLLRQPSLGRAFMDWERLFEQGKGIIGYGFIVGRKIAAA